MPIAAAGTPFKTRSFHGDLIEGGAGEDEIHGGKGYDQINGGEDFDQIFGDSGDDIIDAGTGRTVVDGGTGDDFIKWVYAPFTAGGPLLDGGTGGEQDGDTLDVEVNLSDPSAADIVVLRKFDDSQNDDAAMSVGPDVVRLIGIENVKADVGGEADDLTIEDLLDTSVRTVDLTLGQAKVTQWNVDRDSDGTFQVYPDIFSTFDGDASVRPASYSNDGTYQPDPENFDFRSNYFYRYDLADGGQYLFNSDGSPRLEPVDIPSTIIAADNSIQEFVIADGLDRVLLYYGLPHNSAVVQAGVHTARIVAAQNGQSQINAVQHLWLADGVNQTTLSYGADQVTIESDDSGADLQSKLSTIDQAVTVTGTGTQSDPWEVTFTDAAKVNGNFQVLSYAMTAADIEAAIESIAAVGPYATVSGAGTSADPWVVTFLPDATEDDDGNFLKLTQQYLLQSFVGSVTPRDDVRVFERLYRLTDPDAEYLFNPDGTPDLATISQPATKISLNAVQQFALGLSEARGILWYGNQGVAAERGLAAEMLEARLQQLEGVGTLTLERGIGATAPWTFSGTLKDSSVSADELKTRLESVSLDDDDDIDDDEDNFTVSVTGDASGWQFESTGFLRNISEQELKQQLLTAAGILEIAVTGTGTEDDPWEFSFGGVTNNIVLLTQLGLAANASDKEIAEAVRAVSETNPSVADDLGVANLSDAQIASIVSGMPELLAALEPADSENETIADTAKMTAQLLIDLGLTQSASDADIAAAAKAGYMPLEFVAGGGAGLDDSKLYARAVFLADEADGLGNERQQIALPKDAIGASLQYGNESVDVTLDLFDRAASAAAIEQALRGLTAIGNVAVAAGNSADAPFKVVLIGAETLAELRLDRTPAVGETWKLEISDNGLSESVEHPVADTDTAESIATLLAAALDAKLATSFVISASVDEIVATDANGSRFAVTFEVVVATEAVFTSADQAAYRTLQHTLTKQASVEPADVATAFTNDMQIVEIAVGAEVTFRYGMDSVKITNLIAGAQIKAALEGLDALRDINVAVSGPDASDIWTLHFTPKESGGTPSYEVLQYAVTQTVTNTAVDATTVTRANGVQLLGAPGDFTSLWLGSQPEPACRAGPP